METKDRVAIISQENMDGIKSLYGDLSLDDLTRIVNRHVAVALQEIREDEQKGRKTAR